MRGVSMDNGMENMLDMYLFETNSLLEQLDEVLLDAEKADTFTTDNVNEIFRIMHTIKGSSAMMEFSSLMTIAHRIEDLFFFIRENTIDSIDEEHKRELFDLMFFSTDMLRAEVEKLENNEPLTSNVDSFVEKVNSFLNKISNKTDNEAVSDDKKAENSEKAENSSTNLPEDGSGAFLKVTFDEGCGMENLRAFMLVTAVKDIYENLTFYPSDVETNPETAAAIVEKGFLLGFDTKETLDAALNIVQSSGNVQSYEVLMPPPVEKEEKAVDVKEEKESTVPNVSAASTQKVQAPTPTQQSANANAMQHIGANKQSLISVNLSKLDKLMDLMGELVITESMVTSSPELQGLKLDNFTKSARQLRKLTDDLQDTVMSIRMIPVAGAFQKMNRIVREDRKSVV